MRDEKEVGSSFILPSDLSMPEREKPDLVSEHSAYNKLKNPLREGMRIQRAAEPCAMVLFGASGDLARRKLIPALFNLWLQQLLPPGFTLLGTSRTEMGTDEFRRIMRDAISEFEPDLKFDEQMWQAFAEGLFYAAADAAKASDFKTLFSELQRIERERGTEGNRLYYLSIPPSLFDAIADQIKEFNLTKREKGWDRIVLEKPFGRDLDSAIELNDKLGEIFREDQVFRIDHFLGKETVQNLLVFRFSNGLFEPVWNRRYVDHVQITAAEQIGVGSRAGFYEEAGALRDMIQNHCIQLLSLVAMDPPVSFEAEDVRNEKVRLMHAIRPFTHEEVNEAAVRGQYGPGTVNGERVAGYREEEGVDPESATETYAAVKFAIDNWRWADVPFYIRSGKRLAKRVTEIAIRFKRVPHLLFGRTPENQIEPNQLILRIQPDEGITLRFGAKVPDLEESEEMKIRQVNMTFEYDTTFASELPEAYERLLRDAMLGDARRFARRDMVETAWAIVQPILDVWGDERPEDFPNYDAGTWGPEAADKLIEKDGCRWRRP